MTDPKKPTREDLIALLPSKSWSLDGDAKKDRTLEDAVRAAYEKQKSGEDVGLVKRIENAFELDLIQLQELWEHLGLPL